MQREKNLSWDDASIRPVPVGGVPFVEGIAARAGGEDLVKANFVLIVWLFALAVGGGLLTQYYAAIRYIPEVDWHSCLTYMAAATFIGGAIGTLLWLLVYLPGFIWSQFLICDEGFVRVFCYSPPGGREAGREVTLWEILKRLGAPFGIVLIVTHLIPPTWPWPYALSILIALVVGSLWIVAWQRQRLGGGQSDGERADGDLFKYVFWFDLSLLLSQTAVFILYQITDRPGVSDRLLMAAPCILIIMFSNLVAAMLCQKQRRRAVVASLVAALLLLIVANRLHSLPRQLMTHFGFGDQQKVAIVLTESGVKTAESLGLRIDSGTNRLSGIEILSRLGSEYFLRSAEGERFTLPKDAVSAWKTEKAIPTK